MSDESHASPESVVEVALDDDSVNLSFSGEFDVAVADVMRQGFLRDDVMGSASVRADLSGVTFLDSACLGILISACRRVRESGGTFVVACAAGSASRRLIEISGLMDYLQVDEGR